MNRAKQISDDYAYQHTCYANDPQSQYLYTRKAVEFGYHQAEKDLKLTWKDFGIIHENTLDKPHGGCFSMSAPSIMGAMAGYMCDNYWFCDKPNKDEMFCGGRKYESFYKI